MVYIKHDGDGGMADETRYTMTVMESWLTKPTDAVRNRFEMI